MINESELEVKCQDFMNDLKKEIDQLEYQIHHIKMVNFKRNCIRKLKISGRVLESVTPYLLVAGATFGGISLITGNIPFHIDMVPYYEHTRMEIDNQGNIISQKQYDSFEEEENTLSYTSKWKDIGDGFYERNSHTYVIPYLDYDKVMTLLENDDLSMKNVLVNVHSLSNTDTPFKTKSSFVETRNHIPEGDLNQDYLNIVLYQKNKDNSILKEESSKEDTMYGIMYALLTILAEIGISEKTNGFHINLDKWIKDINEKYQPVDEKVLRKELKIKLDNYQCLEGDSCE